VAAAIDRANTLIRKGRLREAQAVLQNELLVPWERTEKGAAAQVDLLGRLGECLSLQDKNQEAIEVFTMAVELEDTFLRRPDSPFRVVIAGRMLTEFILNEQAHHDAVRVLEEDIAIKRAAFDSHGSLARTLQSLGQALIDRLDFDEGLRYLHEALEMGTVLQLPIASELAHGIRHFEEVANRLQPFLRTSLSVDPNVSIEVESSIRIGQGIALGSLRPSQSELQQFAAVFASHGLAGDEIASLGVEAVERLEQSELYVEALSLLIPSEWWWARCENDKLVDRAIGATARCWGNLGFIQAHRQLVQLVGRPSFASDFSQFYGCCRGLASSFENLSQIRRALDVLFSLKARPELATYPADAEDLGNEIRRLAQQIDAVDEYQIDQLSPN
jgi:tetratricopeptide (TPR) repeat protein